MNFKFSTNFLLSYVRKPAKYGGRGSTGLDATSTVQIHICHPVHYKQAKLPKHLQHSVPTLNGMKQLRCD